MCRSGQHVLGCTWKAGSETRCGEGVRREAAGPAAEAPAARAAAHRTWPMWPSSKRTSTPCGWNLGRDRAGVQGVQAQRCWVGSGAWLAKQLSQGGSPVVQHELVHNSLRG